MSHSPASSSPAGRTRRSRPLLTILIISLSIGVAVGGSLWWWNHLRKIEPIVLTQIEQSELEERIYEKGEKSLILSEREMNGLIHTHSQFGEAVQVKLVSGAIHLRIKTKLDSNVPILGGKTVNAKARLIASNEEGLILDDLTVYGVSLPNAWLGELKGKNLFEALEGHLPAGISSIEIRNGEIQIELED